MDFRREIDGLRALAVLPIILFYAGFETFSAGFVGVINPSHMVCCEHQ